jgi:hypothetical protein
MKRLNQLDINGMKFLKMVIINQGKHILLCSENGKLAFMAGPSDENKNIRTPYIF